MGRPWACWLGRQGPQTAPGLRAVASRPVSGYMIERCVRVATSEGRRLESKPQTSCQTTTCMQPQLYELHGNTNLERCPKCGAEYMRDFRTRNSTKGVHHHGTGRTCTKEGCGTELYVLVVGGASLLSSAVQSPPPAL